jgi:hypothetical protein
MTEGPFFGSSGRRRRRPEPFNMFPTADEIAERAYQLFAAEKSRVDDTADYWRRLEDCWRRAENELLDRAARRVVG